MTTSRGVSRLIRASQSQFRSISRPVSVGITALIRSVLDAARARGVLQVELCVDARNAGARALYETMGFVAFGLRPRSVIVDGAARDDVLMLCKLD